ncbi:MAG: lysylphosphatidylglycerol synthase transmembrane domain-containing protein [Candidatus Eisenbacteria bacterium]
MKGNLLRLLVTIALLALVLSRVDWGEFRRAGSEVRLLLLAAGYALNLVMVFLNTYRWQILIRPLGASVGLLRLTAYYFVCMFFNNLMPTSIGGDVIRVLDLSRDTGERSSAMASVVVERLLGLYALLPISIGAILLLYPTLPERGSFLAAGGAMALLFAAGTVAIRRRTLRRLEPFLKPFAPLLARLDVRRRAGKLYDFLDAYKRARGAVLAAFLLSVLSRSVWVFGCWVLAESLGVHLSVAHFFLLMPLVEIGRMLPLSLAGLGIREGVMLLLLRLFDVSDTRAVLLAFLIYGIFVVNGLIGGIVYGARDFIGGRKRRGDAAA